MARGKKGTGKPRDAKAALRLVGPEAAPPRPPKPRAPTPRRSAKHIPFGELLEALTTSEGVTEAARILRVTVPQLAERLDDEDTADQLRAARLAAAGHARTRLVMAMPLAAKGMVELAEDSGPQDSVRMAALRTVLDIGEKAVAIDASRTEVDETEWEFPEFPIAVVGAKEDDEEEDADEG